MISPRGELTPVCSKITVSGYMLQVGWNFTTALFRPGLKEQGEMSIF